MLIRISEIPDEGLRIESAAGLADVFPEESWRLNGVTLLIERRGDDVVVTGRFEASARLACSRCLEELETRVAPTVDLHLIPEPRGGHEEVELGPDDLEVDFYRGDTLDVGRLLQGETHLALPMKPLCQTDCRGLCSVCGGNRNVNRCACEASRVDPRLAPLEGLRRLR